MNAITRNLFLKALNRLRRQLFGDDPLTLFDTTPETGETAFVSFLIDWNGFRKSSEIDSGTDGFWIFQIAAADDWKTSELYMHRMVAFTIGDRRWKVKKVEKPIGNSKVWKLKAEIQ